MAAIDQARNPVENLLFINSPNENSASFVPDSRRSPLAMNNSSFTIIPNLLDLDQQQLQELFGNKDDYKVKEEPRNEVKEEKKKDVAMNFDTAKYVVPYHPLRTPWTVP